MRGLCLFVLSAGAFFQFLDSATLPPNPCPKFFEYLNDTNGDVYGRITMENDYSGHFVIAVNMSVAAYLVGEENMELQIESTEADIRAQRPLVYNISFPIQSVIPRLTRIELNNKEYCSGPPEELGPKGVTEMWAASFYTIELRRRPPTTFLVPESPVTLASPQLSTDFDNTTEPLPWEPWGQHLTDSNASAPLPWESWQTSSTGTTRSTPPSYNPWQHTPTRLPTWIHTRRTTASTTSTPYSSRPWTPRQPTSTQDTPVPSWAWERFPFTTPSSSKQTSTASTETSRPSTAPSQLLPWLTRGPPGAAATTAAPLTIDFSLSGKDCGLSMVNTQEGDDFVDGQFPWLVAIQYRKDFDYNYMCTGTLVSNHHIITAGHCVKSNKKIQNYQLVFGKKDVQSWAHEPVVRELEQIIVHPDYKESKGDGDIAILRVKTSLEFEPGIKPVCLAYGEENLNKVTGMQGTVVGWWTYGKGSSMSFKANQINFRMVYQTQCLQSVPSFALITSSRTFCAGLNSVEPCHGDSGAGFAMQKDGRWILKGVMSTARGDMDSCDVENYFIFVNVAKLMSWITQKMT